MKQKWVDEGNIFFPIPGNTVLHEIPGQGVWQVVLSPHIHDNRLGLVKISDKFEFSSKVYDLGLSEFENRIKTVWNSDLFVKDSKNLGIILNGIKGAGKSWFAKTLCNKLNMPVVIVNNSFEGRIVDFIQSLNFECTVFIDEAEKTFKKGEDDEVLLRLIDGMCNETRKLYILTTNTLNVNENLLGRPGRIRYIQEFKNLPASVVNEFIDDNLNDKSLKKEILEKVDLLEISTIDIIKSLVEEYNILGGINENDPLNIPMAKYVYNAAFFPGCSASDIPEIEKVINTYKQDPNVDMETWLDLVYKGDEELEEEDPTNLDLLAEKIKSCNYIYTQKITTSFSKFWKDSITSRGIVVEEPKNGFMVIKDLSEGETVVLILHQLLSPSLYRGKLL